MKTVPILTALALLVSVAAVPATSPESSDLSTHLDDHETVEPQTPAIDLLARDASFTTDLEDTDSSAAPEVLRDSRSPHFSKKYKSKGKQYRPQVQYYQPQVQYYKPQVQYYQPQPQYYKPQVQYYHPQPQYYKPKPQYYTPVKQYKIIVVYKQAQKPKGGKGYKGYKGHKGHKGHKGYKGHHF